MPPLRVTILDYQPDLVTSQECNPTICFWASKDAGHGFVKVDPAVTKSFELNINDSLSKSSTLSFQAFVETKNTRSQPSCNEAGGNHINFTEIVKADQATIITDVPLIVWNARRTGVDAVKGKFSFRVEAVPQAVIDTLFLPAEPQTLIGENQDTIKDILVGHLQRQNLVFETKKHTFPQLASLHLPTWNYNGWQLPGATFAMVRAKPSPEAWWTNALDIALQRHYPKMSLKGASSFMMHLASEDELVTIMSKMHSIYINYCTYLNDGIPVKKRNTGINLPFCKPKVDWEFIPMEAFSNNIRSRGTRYRLDANKKVVCVPAGADCEDGGCMQGIESVELLNRSDWTDPRLMKLHEIRKNYFYLQVLMGVRGGQLADGKDEGESAFKDLGGHMAGAYQSREQFFRNHKRYNTVDQPYEGMSLPSDSGVKRPMKFMEGTGLIDPGASPEYAESMASYIYLNDTVKKALSVGKFIAPQSRVKQNNFYRVVQSYCVVDLADEGFTSIEHIPLKRVNGEMRAGVSYLDLINESADIATYAQPPMDIETVKVTRELLNQMFPIEAFEVPDRLASEKAMHAGLESIKEYTKKLGRPHADDYDVVQMYLRFDEIDSVVETYKQLVGNAKRVFKFNYFNEEITKGFGGMQVRFYVTKVAPTPAAAIGDKKVKGRSSPAVARQLDHYALLGHPHFNILKDNVFCV